MTKKSDEVRKKSVAPSDILQSGDTFLFIKGSERETEQNDDYGGFGFS